MIRLEILKIKLIHWWCMGIYVRTKTSYSSIRNMFPTLNQGAVFKSKSIMVTDGGVVVKDQDGWRHKFYTEIRPSTKIERAKFFKTQRATKASEKARNESLGLPQTH